MRKPGHQGMSCSTELNGPSKTIPPRPSTDIPRKTRRPTRILPALVLPASPFEVVVTLNYVTPPIAVRATKRTERLQDLARPAPAAWKRRPQASPDRACAQSWRGYRVAETNISSSSPAGVSPVRVATRRLGRSLAVRSGNGAGRSPASKAPLGGAPGRLLPCRPRPRPHHPAPPQLWAPCDPLWVCRHRRQPLHPRDFQLEPGPGAATA